MSDLQQEQDEYWMMQALRLAQSARDQGEVPVGAILVKNNIQIAEAWNQPITHNDPSAHAEILCLRAAGQREKNYRLNDSTLYVTLEPCAMCVGAIVHARVGRLVYAASEPKAGCVHSHDLLNSEFFNRKVEVTAGVLEQEASTMLSDFFAQRRKEKKQNKQAAVVVEKESLPIQDTNHTKVKTMQEPTQDKTVQEKPIASPCISVCALDENDICAGCYRHVDEITEWASYNNAEKLEVLKKSQKRMNDMWSL